MAATHNEPSIEELEEDLRRAVQLWGDDCSTAEALRKVIREMKKGKKADGRQASKRGTYSPEQQPENTSKEDS